MMVCIMSRSAIAEPEVNQRLNNNNKPIKKQRPNLRLDTVSQSDESISLSQLLAVIAAMIGAILEVLDVSITNVAIPQMMGNLGATLSEIGWVSTGYIISNVIILPMTGWLAERLTRRKYFALSVTIFTIASLMCGLSNSLSALVFWRITQGLGGGGLLATGQVITLQMFPKKKQGLATAIFGVGVMVGPSLGPVLGGYLTDNFSWPWIFFINIPFGIIAVVLTWLYVPKGKAITNKPVDLPGIGLLAVSMGALQIVLERGQESDWFESSFITAMTWTAVLGMAAFIWRELSTDHPVVDIRILKNRSLSIGVIYNGLLGFSLYSTLFLLPVFLQNAQGYTAFATGMIMMPAALISMVSFMAASFLTQRVDARKILGIGAVFMITGAMGLTYMTVFTGGDNLFVTLLVRGFSLGFLFIPLTLSSLSDLKPDQMGVGSGLINLTRQLGGSIGIATLSTLLSRRLTFHQQSISQNLYYGNHNVDTWIYGVQAWCVGHGYSKAGAHVTALKALSLKISQQAYIMSFNDCFLMIVFVFSVAIPLTFLFKKGTATVDMGSVH